MYKTKNSKEYKSLISVEVSKYINACKYRIRHREHEEAELRHNLKMLRNNGSFWSSMLNASKISKTIMDINSCNNEINDCVNTISLLKDTSEGSLLVNLNLYNFILHNNRHWESC